MSYFITLKRKKDQKILVNRSYETFYDYLQIAIFGKRCSNFHAARKILLGLAAESGACSGHASP